MTDNIIYCVQFIEYDLEDLIFQPIHCKNKDAILKCVQNNFIDHMREYKELYTINDEDLLEIIYNIKFTVNLKEIKQLVRQHAVENDGEDILFGWVVYEYSRKVLEKLLEPDKELTG
jgi:phenolic acid decarboxylase